VTYTVANTGSRDGAEASQVYLTLPQAAGEPSKRLVGFQKVDLPAGASQTVTVIVDPSASNHPLSYWVPATMTPAPTGTPVPSEGARSGVNGTTEDAAGAGWSQGAWSTPLGDYVVSVGTSSADTPLQEIITLAASPDATGCVAPAPAADWVCVDGGWFPPAAVPVAPAPGPAAASAPAPRLPVAPAPQVFTIGAAPLAEMRENLKQGHPQFQSALNAVISDAKSALNIKPIFVMNKAATLPSGGKHDDVSHAAYWWPARSKPYGFPYVREGDQRDAEIERISHRVNLGRFVKATATLDLASLHRSR
jgi:hypothetical protein